MVASIGWESLSRPDDCVQVSTGRGKVMVRRVLQADVHVECDRKIGNALWPSTHYVGTCKCQSGDVHSNSGATLTPAASAPGGSLQHRAS